MRPEDGSDSISTPASAAAHSDVPGPSPHAERYPPAVLALLRDADPCEGLALRSLILELAPPDEMDIWWCVANLECAGEIYATIDDEHFALAQAG